MDLIDEMEFEKEVMDNLRKGVEYLQSMDIIEDLEVEALGQFLELEKGLGICKEIQDVNDVSGAVDCALEMLHDDEAEQPNHNYVYDVQNPTVSTGDDQPMSYFKRWIYAREKLLAEQDLMVADESVNFLNANDSGWIRFLGMRVADAKVMR